MDDRRGGGDQGDQGDDVLEGLAGLGHPAVEDGEAALRVLRDSPPDLLVLDVMLPEPYDGLEIARRVRAAGADVPILMLTARDQVADKVAGFASGADDYLAKPFAFEELLARVQALLRRSAPRQVVNEPLRYA